MRFPDARVRSLAGEIEANRIGAAELANRIVDFEMKHVRQLGRLLLERAKEKDGSETNEYIAVVRRRCFG